MVINMNITDIGGEWQVTLEDGGQYPVFLPGTLDENHIGHPDSSLNTWKPMEVEGGREQENILLNRPDIIATRLTRKYTYEGKAVYSRALPWEAGEGPAEERIFLEAERTRKLALVLNGSRVEPCREGTLSTPCLFEVTGRLQENNRIEMICDNSYQGWPREAIVYSSAATDETQTNWNGILGFIRLRREKKVFIGGIRVYPKKNLLSVQVDIDGTEAYHGVLILASDALKEKARKEISVPAGLHTIVFDALPLKDDIRRWDEYEGNLYELSAAAEGLEEKAATFGVRDFEDDGRGRLALNGRAIFLRSEANCCVFPETGHMPLTVEEWEAILNRYKAYGVNCLRFHSHCPPEAAFAAADRTGMLLQPELSHWDYKTAFEEENSRDYYLLELMQILYYYANHPSFVMLTFGNELQAGETGHRIMDGMLVLAKAKDSTRLYACGSNVHYGMEGADNNSDFYTSSNFYEKQIRGTCYGMTGYINEGYPNTRRNFDKEMECLRKNYKGPVFSFEVGQYESLPDFDELEAFQGVTCAKNLMLVKEEAEKRGMLSSWKRRVEATGELARIAYREEIEAVLRTKELSGISLLGLQDFPGQGTALIGMLNSHLEPKPFAFAKPENFRAFFTGTLPLVLMDKYTYTNGEELLADIEVVNYGKKTIQSPAVCELHDGEKEYFREVFPAVNCQTGIITSLGKLSIPLYGIKTAQKCLLSVRIGEFYNEYPVWVYPEEEAEAGEDIVIAKTFTEAVDALEEGKTVFYTPKADKEHFPASAQGQFTTDFWSVGTFPVQEGCMGCLMDPAHPVFSDFPTEFYSNWQWWPMSGGRAMFVPGNLEPLITVIDCYAKLRNMAFLFECKTGGGRLMVSSMGLLEKQGYPEARALYRSIVKYMTSEKFKPSLTLSVNELKKFL
ncbi:hypothetical protein [Anaerocolumna jejuensis]|uniref:hypothetical protein n=1 Tax=Anaerocolumna jejuensis TaxID=259063 RepID=UPI003F7B3F27